MKKHLISIIAVVLALTTVSFTKIQREKEEQTFQYYIFNGAGTMDLAALKNPANWSPTTAASCGGGTAYICKIKFSISITLTTILGSITVYIDFATIRHADKAS